jgi:CheY-like chemotaxis protein
LLTGRKLLLADDSLTIQKVVSLTFTDEAMEVITVGSGAQAIEKLNENLPDIVLADVFMPEPNGYQLCEHIKGHERTRHIPVVLLVSTFEPFNEAEARRVGADDVLTKPFQSIRDLMNKVGGLLGGDQADEKTTLGAHLRDDRREEEEAMAAAAAMHNLSPLSTQTHDAESATNTSAPDLFDDFGMDDATIQAVPVAEFEAREHAAIAGADAPLFSEIDDSEIKQEEQFSDRAETNEAFVLSADPANSDSEMMIPAQTDMDVSIQTDPQAALTANASDTSPLAQTAFATHMARAAEADDTLLELGDITPMRNATEADDFILDIGDEELFDSSPAAPHHAAAEDDDLLFAEDVPAAQLSETFAEPETFVPSTPPTATSPVQFAPEEPEDLLDWTPEETAWEMPAPAGESPSIPASAFAPASAPAAMPDSTTGEIAPAFDSAAAVASVAAAGESRAVTTQETTPAPASQEQTSLMSPEMLDEVVRRVVAQMSERVVREIAWEVVPDLAERLIRQRLEEERSRAQ